MPRHALQRGQLHAAHLLEQMAGQVLEDLEHVLLLYERHLAVNLRELRLAVGTQVFVAEALGYLEVTVETAHHQQLLQCLRALRQGIELAGVHARRHHEVAGTLGRRADEDRRLHLDEVAAVKEVADEDGHPVAQLQVLAHGRTAQVQVAVLHADVVAAVGLILDGEGGREALAEHVQLRYQYLDVARGHLRVLRLALAHLAHGLYAELASQLVRTLTERSVLRLVEHQLCNTIAVAQVDERHAAHLARALNPSGELHLAAGVGETKLATCLSPIHFLRY